MSPARVTLTIGHLSHEAAHALTDHIENDFRLEPLAVTINETDEAKALWETDRSEWTKPDDEHPARMESS